MEFKYLSKALGIKKEANEVMEFKYLTKVLEKSAEEMAEEPILITPEELVAELEHAVTSGEITEEEALEILQQAEEALRQHFEQTDHGGGEEEIEKEASLKYNILRGIVKGKRTAKSALNAVKNSPETIMTAVKNTPSKIKSDLNLGVAKKLVSARYKQQRAMGANPIVAGAKAVGKTVKERPYLAVVPGVGIVGVAGGSYALLHNND